MSNLVYVLNGPNLNLLGLREPEIYGSTTLDEIAGMLEDRGRELGLTIDMRQTNHEGMLVDWLHEAQVEGARAVLSNAGAYTHTSIALLQDQREAAALGVRAARAALESYGRWYGPYPYGHLTIVDPVYRGGTGGIGGWASAGSARNTT